MSWCYIYYITSVILYIYSGYVTASEYYVSATPNGESCPSTDLPCHNLSYYIADYPSYFTDDTIFYFLEGTHTLQGTLEISGVSNITLQGLGHIEQGFHETVMQSTSVIRCSDYNKSGIQFTSSTDVVLKSLTITNCGAFYNTTYRQANVSLLFVDTYNIMLEWVSVQNSSGFGLFLVNGFNVLLAYSSFAQNRPLKTCFDCSGGNVYILYYNQSTNKTLYNVDIVQSNFTFGLNPKVCTVKEYNKYHYISSSSGGLTIFLFNTQSYNIKFNIDNVVFYNNTASAGANFVFLANSPGFYSLTMSNTISTYGKTLISNTDKDDCTFAAGMTLLQNNGADKSEIIIENCTFKHNLGQQFGGGIFIGCAGTPGNVLFCNCTIYNNTAYYGSGMLLYGLNSTLLSLHFANILIDSNKVPITFDRFQAAVLLAYINNAIFEQINVTNHNITGLLSYNSQLTFLKNSYFVNNLGILGGGMALYESSHLILKEQTNISFISNYASEFGGGIFVSETIITHNIRIDCFFKTKYNHSNNITLYFINNTADISGDVLYGGNVDYCLISHQFQSLFHYPQQNGSSVVSSDPIQVCFCEANKPNCSIKHINITAIPGIDVSISLATVGSKNGLTKGVIKFTLSNTQTVNTRLNANCTDVTFSITANSSLNTTQVYVTLEKSIKPLYDTFAKVIDIIIQSCPIGFPLDITNNTCACKSELIKPPAITCDINTQIITREGDMWIGYENDPGCLIVYENCPFDYCKFGTVHFKITSPDPQCLRNHSGILCGQCAKGLSLMLGSNQCGQCTNNYIALIIPFALAGIALVAFVIVLNLTVSVGTINGLIFYANVVKIYEPIFFSEGPIPFLSQFISWINLDLGIETCFFDGMDSCSKTWLQFIFPAYVWFLLILIIILSRYSSKVVRLVGRQVIPALATMILLSYTKLIRTVFLVFHYTNVPCSGENNVTFHLWYVDATVPYLKGCHLPLFLFSLAVLILLIVPYIFYLLTMPLFEGPLSKYMCCQKLSTYMKPFSNAYGGPYKDKCRFWTGFLLQARVVLALVVSIDIKRTVSLNMLTSISVIIIFMYLPLRGVYRQLPLVCLELFFILNLILLASTNGHTSNENMNLKGQVTTKVLVSLAFVVFCGILIYHVWDQFLKSHLQERIKKLFKTQSNIPANDDNEIELKISSVNNITYYIMPELREPLLDDQDDIIHKK